jgi:hypothetical protein
MKPKIRWMAIVIFAIIFFPMAQAFSSNHAPKGPTLEIVEPAPMQTLRTSNVWITIRFNFTDNADRKTFSAFLNGKQVGALFHYTEYDEARGLISAKDLNASVHGPRMNVFRAEVTGQNGKKYEQTVKFLVDCWGNHRPVADAGQDARVFVHESVVLDGSGSYDKDEDPIAYRWSFVAAPKKSKAELSDPSGVNPSFVPDMPGTYVAQLIVDDYKEESKPKTVTITVDQLKILVDRPVLNEIFTNLSSHGKVDQFNGSQLLSNYHLVALDGAAYTPQQLIGNGLLKKALAEGKWALLFNVTEGLKLNALSSHLGMVNHAGSTAYLFRRYLDGNTPVFRIFDLSPLVLLGEPVPTNVYENIIKPETFLRYAGMILKELRESLNGTPRSSSLGAPGPDSPIPPDLINCRWDYTGGTNWLQNWSGRQAESKGRQQYGTHSVNYTFTLYLDNAGLWTGNKQYLLLQIDGEGNPNNAGYHNADGSTYIATASDMSKCNEFAWFQDRMVVDITPQDGFWYWAANDPTSPNPTTNYTANSSFNVGFNMGNGGLGSYTYSSGAGYSMTDWGISCNSSGTHMYWDIHSQKPDANNGYKHDNSWFYTWCDKPERPNDESLQQRSYHASVVWRTDSIKKQFANIQAHDTQHLVDTFCNGTDWGTTCCNGHGDWYDQTIDSNQTFSLDLAAVVPIEIPSITLSQWPVIVGPSGGTMKASVVLKEPARMDTRIQYIRSTDTAHAVPKVDTLTIPKGYQAGSFLVDVNRGGKLDNDLYFASLSGFYAKTYSQQFQMKAVNNYGLWFPATSPWVDPDWELWGGSYTTTGNWVQGYQVRYAVSFVDSAGRESVRGLWSDWIGPGVVYEWPGVFYDAMPLLVNIPTDATNTAVQRKIYRQFFAKYQNANPEANIELITTLQNNTTTTYLDKNP